MEEPPQTDDTSTKQVLPWYKKPAVRFVIVRVVLRLAMIGVFVAILKIYGATIKAWGEAYLAWIRSLGPVGGPFAFLAVATVFAGISPTGYLPSVAAGITFPYEVSIPLSYGCTVLGALFNLFLVRVVIRQLSPHFIRCCKSSLLWARCTRPNERKRKRRGWTKGLIQALLVHPVRMTILVRLPFLGNGSLNWLLSSSKLPLVPMMIGNCIGMLPGAIVFAVLGMQIRSLASMIAEGNAEPTAIGVMVGLFVVCSVSLLGVIWTTRRVMKKQGLDQDEPEAVPVDETRPLTCSSPTLSASPHPPHSQQQERLVDEPMTP